jgi:hypothetical protein
MEELNIVDLIENNPITKLSGNYSGKMLTKIQHNFTEFEQQLFVTSFYCYLNYDQKTDFVIDLDNVWKWLGFSQKINAKGLLEKQFILDIDYKKSLLDQQKPSEHVKGGHNKEIFMLTVKAFKSFCLKAGTKKADEVHDYFMKLEEILHEVVHEENAELKKQLESNVKQLETHMIQSEKDKEQLVEDTLISQFPLNTQCIYYGKIDNKTLGKAPKLHNEDLIKFGQSNNLAERIKCHKKNFINFRLVAAFKVKNKIEIENAIKRHPILKKQMRTLTVDNPDYTNENYREMLALDKDKFTIEKIDKHIKDIIKENEYNIENYNLLVDKNLALEDELRHSEIVNKQKDEQIEKLTLELQNYKPDATNEYQKKIASNFAINKYGYFLYAFNCEKTKYKCSITRQKDFESLTTNLKNIDSNGEMVYNIKVTYPFSEKIMMFLLKQTLTSIGNNTFDGSFENIKKILDITQKIETMLIKNGDDLDKISDILDGCIISNNTAILDPEVPQVRKSKRVVDQINKETGEVIATYESIEAAGRTLGLTTGTAVGIALREKKVCQGFLWRYSGISKEDQYSDQPVIKVCCSTGEKFCFFTIADAAKDCNISAPGLRARILTNVHANDFHWKFDKDATHYKS